MRLILACLIILGLVACARGSYRTGPPRPIPAADPALQAGAGAAGTGPGSAVPAPLTPSRPVLDREPAIGVLLAQGSRVRFTLAERARVDLGGQIVNLPAGAVTASASADGLVLDRLPGRPCGSHVVFVCDQGGFTAQAMAPDGRETPLSLAGMPEVHLDAASRKVQLVERIGLERYLSGVLAKEMSPTWPLEALKAQAIVARSYTADRFLQNWQRPWQVHWHASVDMAYAGSALGPGRADDAVQATAGEMLLYGGQPVPALFHACSGGRTARVRELKPELTLADGLGDPSPAMPPIDDVAAREGAKGLNLLRTHWQWSASLPLGEVAAALRPWFQSRSPGLVPGEVSGIGIAQRDADGNRVVQVAVTCRQGGRSATLTMPGNEFRLAVGPGLLRSLWWTSCEVKRGTLLVSGRGYGHGVGLSQVSAWYLARSGVTGEDIVRRFYGGATLERKW